MKSFEKTKQLLTQQRVLMGFAIFSTLMLVAVPVSLLGLVY